MDTPDDLMETLTDDQVFDYTQNFRRRYIQTVTKDGTEIPTDPKEARVFLSALADMDKIAIGKKRLRSEEEVQKHSAQAIAELAATVQRALTQNAPQGVDTPREPPRLDDTTMGPLELVPGETLVGHDVSDYAGFEKRLKEEHE